MPKQESLHCLYGKTNLTDAEWAREGFPSRNGVEWVRVSLLLPRTGAAGVCLHVCTWAGVKSRGQRWSPAVCGHQPSCRAQHMLASWESQEGSRVCSGLRQPSPALGPISRAALPFWASDRSQASCLNLSYLTSLGESVLCSFVKARSWSLGLKIFLLVSLVSFLPRPLLVKLIL